MPNFRISEFLDLEAGLQRDVLQARRSLRHERPADLDRAGEGDGVPAGTSCEESSGLLMLRTTSCTISYTLGWNGPALCIT